MASRAYEAKSVFRVCRVDQVTQDWLVKTAIPELRVASVRLDRREMSAKLAETDWPDRLVRQERLAVRALKAKLGPRAPAVCKAPKVCRVQWAIVVYPDIRGPLAWLVNVVCAVYQANPGNQASRVQWGRSDCPATSDQPAHRGRKVTLDRRDLAASRDRQA